MSASTQNEIDFSIWAIAEAREDGREAFWCTSMKRLSDNPYFPGSLMHIAWQEGWLESKAESERGITDE